MSKTHSTNTVLEFFKDLQTGHSDEIHKRAENVHQLVLRFQRHSEDSDIPWGMIERLEEEFDELVSLVDYIDEDTSEVRFIWEDDEHLRLDFTVNSR